MKQSKAKQSSPENVDIPQRSTTPPWSSDVFQGAVQWLNGYGVLTDFHKNTLVTGILMEDRRIRDVAFYARLPQNDGTGRLWCYLYVSRWHLWWMKKRALVESLEGKIRDFVPQYVPVIRFRIWGKTYADDA